MPDTSHSFSDHRHQNGIWPDRSGPQVSHDLAGQDSSTQLRRAATDYTRSRKDLDEIFGPDVWAAAPSLQATPQGYPSPPLSSHHQISLHHSAETSFDPFQHSTFAHPAQDTPSYLDYRKQRALESLFGLPPSVPAPDFQAQDIKGAPAQRSPHPDRTPSPSSKSSLFGILSAAVSGVRPQPLATAPPAQTPASTYPAPASTLEELTLSPNSSLRSRLSGMAGIAEDPAISSENSSPALHRSRTLSTVGQPIPSKSNASTASPSAGFISQPASMPAVETKWDFPALNDTGRLQRRTSQKEGSPSSPGGISLSHFETWTGRRPPEPLPEQDGDDPFQGGIASSNVSPFTRDGRVPLPPLSAGIPTARPREHSLGPVGSGRRSSSAWTGPASATTTTAARTFVFDDNESDEDSSALRSGATSRRHSLASFPSVRSHQTGFTLPTSPSSSHFSPPSAKAPELTPSGPTSGPSALRFDDDELAASLNSLQINLDQHAATNSTPSSFQHTAARPLPGQNQQQPMPPRPPRSQSFNGRRPSAPAIESVYQPLYASPGSPRGNNAAPLPVPQYFVGGAPAMLGSQSQRSVPQPFGLPINRGLSATAQPFQGATPPTHDAGSPLPVYFGAQPQQEPDLAEFGRGVPLHQLPPESRLFVIEFKAGRTDIFFSGDSALQIGLGDVVIVEADRGKDLGSVVHDNISLSDVQAFQKHQVEQALSQLAASQSQNQAPNPQTISRLTREVHPKRILSKATQTDLQLLSSKSADEAKALALCRSKVLQKNLDMLVTDAEWQFDRRKLTLFYIADKRIDFRELVRELFRLFKTRIWMSPVEKIGEGPTPAGRF